MRRPEQNGPAVQGSATKRYVGFGFGDSANVMGNRTAGKAKPHTKQKALDGLGV